MWHKPCRTFHPWCLCIKTRCLLCIFVSAGSVTWTENESDDIGSLSPWWLYTSTVSTDLCPAFAAKFLKLILVGRNPSLCIWPKVLKHPLNASKPLFVSNLKLFSPRSILDNTDCVCSLTSFRLSQIGFSLLTSPVLVIIFAWAFFLLISSIASWIWFCLSSKAFCCTLKWSNIWPFSSFLRCSSFSWECFINVSIFFKAVFFTAFSNVISDSMCSSFLLFCVIDVWLLFSSCR